VRVPEEKIQEIREATDIVEVISQYVTLKKRGKSFVGLCPFHTEKAPSFSVDPVRGFYHCFGCGAGGNVFTFVMQMERVSFPEALRSLAEKIGIALPSYREDDGQAKETEILYRTNQFAADFFRHCLVQTEAGKRALDYLTGRGFDRGVIDAFQVGYAPDLWDGLLKKARSEKIGLQNLQKAGLIVPRKDGEGYYDWFRGRLMFPILNPSGRVIGFGGRTLKEGEGVPKYLNSPETLIYQKSRVLYGLFQSKGRLQRESRALLVEGYTDLLRLHQCGLDYGVATSGTALTEGQARLLFRYTKNVTLIFDGDSAGFDAALRGVDVLVGVGLNVEVAPLPKGSDPDSFLRDQGKEAMEELVRSAKTFVDFRLDRLRDLGRLKTPRERAAAARILLDTIARIGDPLERNLMVKDVAEKLGVEEALLTAQIRRILRGEREETRGIEKRGVSARQAAERGLLMLLLEDGEKWGKVIFPYIQAEYFREREARIVMESLYESFLQEQRLDPRTLLDRYSDDLTLSQYLTELIAKGIGKDVDRSQFGLDCLWELRQEEIRERIRKVREEMKILEARGEEVSEHSQKYSELRRERERVKQEIEEGWKKNAEI